MPDMLALFLKEVAFEAKSSYIFFYKMSKFWEKK